MFKLREGDFVWVGDEIGMIVKLVPFTVLVGDTWVALPHGLCVRFFSRR